MKVLGISPLDKDATASLVEDGRVLFAAGEERFSRVKQHAGFPHKALAAALEATGTEPAQIAQVHYPFLVPDQEARHIQTAMEEERAFLRYFEEKDINTLIAEAERRVPARTSAVHGLAEPNQRMKKPLHKRLAYRYLGVSSHSRKQAEKESAHWAEAAINDHRRWGAELLTALSALGLDKKLKRAEHHVSHAANAYLASGYDRALVVTLDGYGSGLAGSIGIGEGGKIVRKHALRFPHSLGTFYESVTGALGFHPDRHAGKIVGLAAYGDPHVLHDVLMARVEQRRGEFRIYQNLNSFFARHLALRFPMIDVAAAWQHVLERVSAGLVAHWIENTGCKNVVLSGGVTANVKMNQRIHEVDGVEGLFVYPNMGDGGCGTGLAMQATWPGGVGEPLSHVYYGPGYSEAECEAALRAAELSFTRPANQAADLAARIHAGKVVARFDGRMEYGPRALGNRSILYHAREDAVNQWLNKRLGRTEFMPFAPVTLWEARDRCYLGLKGAEHTARFMTVTFDCTDWMKKECPAAVHVDGTARPQLIQREQNPGYYDIIAEYEKLSGIPCLINTSFNMHEEPIVCSPRDAVRAFLDGRLDVLALGPFVAEAPNR